jgi:hypothetical protein
LVSVDVYKNVARVFTLLLWRGATEHCPHFPTHHLLNVCLQIANKWGNLKKNKK